MSDHSDKTGPEDPLPDPDTGKTAGGDAPAASAAPGATPAAPQRRRGGRLLAGLALLLSLGALGGAGFLYYELIYRAGDQDVERRLAEIQSRVAGVNERLESGLSTLAQQRQDALSELREEQAAALAATEAALRESLQDVARQAPPATQEWRRAEARYLLRIANHRLLMEQDVNGALRLLEAADDILAELDDFAFHDVRARLADEIAALENVRGTDVEGLFLRLEALKRDLDELPMRVPEYVAAAEAGKPADSAQAERSPPEDFWGMLEERLTGFLRLRRLDSEVKPLLAPEESVYLELNLRLMLERAQLAAVRREALMYEESLTTAEQWIREHLDTDEPRTRRLLAEIEELRAVNLDRQLPDISGSLNALRAASRNPS